MHSKSRQFGAGVVLMLLASLPGCGSGDEDAPQRAAVEGSVSLDNQPLRQGVIRFVPTNGSEGPKTSVLITQGKFSADAEHGPVVGTHRIEIESTDTAGLAMDDEEALQRLQASGTEHIEVVEIPVVYNRNSTMTETVSADGPNSFEFALSTTPPANSSSPN